MAPAESVGVMRRAANIRSAGSPMGQPSQRKQRAVLTCEECRRKKIRCTRNRNGVCERCKAQGIPCRQSTQESINAPRIVLPSNMDLSVTRLYHVVQDLQRRLGMNDVDLAVILRQHCAPEQSVDYHSGSSYSSLLSPPGSSHGTSSSFVEHFSPITPPDVNDDDDALLSAIVGSAPAGRQSPLFNMTGTDPLEAMPITTLAPPMDGIVLVKCDNGESMPTFPMPRMASHFGERMEASVGAGLPTRRTTPLNDFIMGRDEEWAGASAATASWMLDTPPNAALARGQGTTPQAGYLLDYGEDAWSA